MHLQAPLPIFLTSFQLAVTLPPTHHTCLMIERRNRLWISDLQTNGISTTTNVVDWDERRIVNISGPTKLFPDDEEVEIQVLDRYIDLLSPCAHSLEVDDQGLLISVSSDPKDDTTCVVNYPHYSDVPSLSDCHTVELSRLVEVDRLGPGVDLVQYSDETGHKKKVVFKYSIIFQRLRFTWSELHMLKTIPRHPNLVALDCIVVGDAEARIVGFTTGYIPGKTLDRDKGRVFRLAWLQQLTATVDYLNLERGIIHQDIAPRNIIIDLEDKLRLFDFDRAVAAGGSWVVPERNDIDGVVFTLYEIVTHNDEFSAHHFNGQGRDVVLNLKDWDIKAKLDTDLSLFRQHLTSWIAQRAKPNQALRVQQVSNPDEPPRGRIIVDMDEAGTPIYDDPPYQTRVKALEFGQNVVSWERPPYHKMYPISPEE